MNLDDFSSFPKIDLQDMLAEIDGLPDQLQAAWDFGQTLSLPEWEGISRVLIAGMGGSAIGADLLAAYAAPHCPVPIFVHRDYALPAWVRGPETLVIASSHSGNTEETLSAFEQAVANKCCLLAVTRGGKLAAVAQEAGAAVWKFEHEGQPRAAVGYSFGLLLAVFTHLGLLPDPADELQDAIAAMREQQIHLRADVPVTGNPAKLMAGQCINRWVAVMGAGILTPVARRWKGQISELAKAWGQFEFLPEANHNTLAGVVNPEDALARTMVIFLRARSNYPRNQLRTELTKQILMLEGLNTDFIDSQGDTALSQLWTALHFGDYFAYYLAMAYDTDPTPVEAIEGLKVRLQEA
ncbi:MAG: bifunctional phosphoglucose/phosphomannose isomerase [Chloroflexi bacterium]|nr:bifunctional phosphoglucose/phosphomannose isomerase [Chloroflexota bacterium]